MVPLGLDLDLEGGCAWILLEEQSGHVMQM